MPESTNVRTSAPGRLSGAIARALLSAALLALVCFLLATATSVHAAASPSESALLPAGTISGQTHSLQGQEEPAPPSPLLYWTFGCSAAWCCWWPSSSASSTCGKPSSPTTAIRPKACNPGNARTMTTNSPDNYSKRLNLVPLSGVQIYAV